MRGYSKKGKNHPGLTGVQRVLNTRDREAVVEEPCKVSRISLTLLTNLKMLCSLLVQSFANFRSNGVAFSVHFGGRVRAKVSIENYKAFVRALPLAA